MLIHFKVLIGRYWWRTDIFMHPQKYLLFATLDYNTTILANPRWNSTRKQHSQMYLHYCVPDSKMSVCHHCLMVSEHRARGEGVTLLTTNSGQFLKSLSKRGKCERDQKPSNGFIKYEGQSGTQLNTLQLGCLRQKLCYWFPALWQREVIVEGTGTLVKNLNISRGEN